MMMIHQSDGFAVVSASSGHTPLRRFRTNKQTN